MLYLLTSFKGFRYVGKQPEGLVENTEVQKQKLGLPTKKLKVHQFLISCARCFHILLDEMGLDQMWLDKVGREDPLDMGLRLEILANNWEFEVTFDKWI